MFEFEWNKEKEEKNIKKHIKKKEKNMKKEIKYINGNKVTIIDEPCDYLEDELPEEIDFSKLKRIENPFTKNKSFTVTLEPDIAKHFKSSKQLNQFLRLQLKSFEKIVYKTSNIK